MDRKFEGVYYVSINEILLFLKTLTFLLKILAVALPPALVISILSAKKKIDQVLPFYSCTCFVFLVLAF